MLSDTYTPSVSHSLDSSLREGAYSYGQAPSPRATATTAACGRNREELLGQRPARHEHKRSGNPLKAEYLIPIFIGELLEQGKMSVKVLKTNDTWYGMTYHEDVAAVKDSFKKMLEKGVYKADLFADL